VSAQLKAAPSGKLPILGWYSIPANQTTVERYQELKNSGLTCSFTFLSNADEVEKALKAAQKAGVKLIISCPELKTSTVATIKRFMKNPALAGYFLTDEPRSADFDSLALWVRAIQGADPSHFCYINLLPNYADMRQLGVRDYRDYVHQFIEKVPVKLLTFDYYPVVGDTIRDSWYENLEVFSDEAGKAHRPFWAFALTTAHATYPVPTPAQLRMQMFSNLAYGAQGLEYFTYWTPESKTWDFHKGPITPDGKRTEVYDRMKAMNKKIQAFSGVFLGAKLISVGHTGKEIPSGTHRLETLPEPVRKLSTPTGGAIVSVLRNGNYEFLVIVNRSFKWPMELMLETDPGVQRILTDGTTVPANSYHYPLGVLPGDVVIYRWGSTQH
jgi:hypothetical protein